MAEHLSAASDGGFPEAPDYQAALETLAVDTQEGFGEPAPAVVAARGILAQMPPEAEADLVRSMRAAHREAGQPVPEYYN